MLLPGISVGSPSRACHRTRAGRRRSRVWRCGILLRRGFDSQPAIDFPPANFDYATSNCGHTQGTALDNLLVLFFPDQHLSPRLHRGFALYFGELEPGHNQLQSVDPAIPEVCVLDSHTLSSTVSERGWEKTFRTDTRRARPPFGVSWSWGRLRSTRPLRVPWMHFPGRGRVPPRSLFVRTPNIRWCRKRCLFSLSRGGSRSQKMYRAPAVRISDSTLSSSRTRRYSP